MTCSSFGSVPDSRSVSWFLLLLSLLLRRSLDETASGSRFVVAGSCGGQGFRVCVHEGPRAIVAFPVIAFVDRTVLFMLEQLRSVNSLLGGGSSIGVAGL